jgi:hypothetical protein
MSQLLFPEFPPSNSFIKAAFDTANGSVRDADSCAADLISGEPSPKDQAEKLVPMSFRVTEGERAQIRKDAGKVAVSTYIRQRLLGERAVQRKPLHAQKQRQPVIDHTMLAQLLGMLGQSELATSLMAPALAAQSGAMPVDEAVTEKLHNACDCAQDMRVMLITALNIKVEPGR